MMSSWRSGSVSSCTALSANGARSQQRRRATATATTPSRTQPAAQDRAARGWRLRRPRGRAARSACAVPARSCGSASQAPQTARLELLERAGVCDAYVARCGLLLLRELARGALVDGLVAARGRRARARTSSSATTAIVASNAVVHAGLEQQRDLDDERARRRLARRLGARATRRSARRRAARACPPARRARRRRRTRGAAIARAVDDAAGRDLVAPARRRRRRAPPGRA